MVIILKKYLNNRALTLTELIIAMCLTGIVVLGVIAADQAIRRHGEAGLTGQLKGFQVQALLEQIIGDAVLAEGFLTPSVDKGIRVDSSIHPTSSGDSLGSRTFCIRPSLASTNWVCYTAVGGSVPYTLYRCSRVSLVGPACTAADTNLGVIQSLEASFTTDTTVGSQKLLFYVKIGMEESGTLKEFSAEVTPPKHRL